MLPTVDESVLKRNPDFAALYRKLTVDVLNPDGSTKQDASAAKERAALRQVCTGYQQSFLS